MSDLSSSSPKRRKPKKRRTSTGIHKASPRKATSDVGTGVGRDNPHGSRRVHGNASKGDTSQRRDTSDSALPEVVAGLVSRREFLYGALGAGVLVVGGGAFAVSRGCSKDDEASPQEAAASEGAGDDASVSTLDVSDDQVESAADFEVGSVDEYLSLSATYDLPMGCLLYMDTDDFSVVLVPGEAGESLVKLGFFDVDTGALSYTLEKAIGEDEGFTIYDARANDQIVVWVESNFLTEDWRVYLASVQDSSRIGDAVLVDQGNADYDPPLLCVCGDKAVWTVLPYESGSASTEDSFAKTATVQDTTPQILYTSHGRMITNPQATENIVTIVPRVDTDSVYYQLTALDGDTLKTIAVDILPQAMKVSDAIYLSGEFAFGIESSYSYGGGISRFGTYREFEEGSYLRFNKTPADTPALCGSCLMVKSTKSIVGIDMERRRQFSIDTLEGCVDYGDYLASTGVCQKVVIFTTVAATDGSGSGSTKVRIFNQV